MQEANIGNAKVKASSYPTYEEWKLGNGIRKYTYEYYSSYPTYEEWKLFSHFFSPPFIICSYPTYEEWKRRRGECTMCAIC